MNYLLSLLLMGAMVSPLTVADDAISWYTANFAFISGVAIHVFWLARFIATKLPNPTPGSYLDQFAQWLTYLGIVIPPDPYPYVPSPTPVPTPTALGSSMNVGIGDNPLLRLHIRRQARAMGVEIPDEESMSAIVQECHYRRSQEAGATEVGAGGLIAALLAWMVANPETVAAIIKMVISIFAKKGA